MSAGCTAVQLFAGAGNTAAYHYLMPVNCHFRHCKALLVTSLTQVSRLYQGLYMYMYLAFTFA